MTASGIRTKDLAATALCTAIIVVCAQISIPLPNMVPITLQTFAVAFCGYLLMPKFAAMAITAYLLLGAAGVPVFSSLRGGFQMLTGPTGGFLIGFIPMILLCSLTKRKFPALVLGLLGLAVCHLAGVVQYMLLTHISFWAAMLKVSVPFLAKDVLSVPAALLMASKLRPLLRTE
ncbi:MAG: biotin transporter BioY [Oscillospiraceae bacterium]|nr:biotin transporter BioY [Oscillospiraceae bacterium]